MADIDYIRKFMSEEDLNDCNSTNEVWTEHHAFKSWMDESWARKPEVEYYFGGYADVEDLCKKTQFIQAMNYRSLFEEMRKQWPYCAMALNWCFNEPWPTAANNSLVSYPDVVKPAYYTVKQALRPSLASLRANKNLWKTGENFRAEIWMLNDSIKQLSLGKVEIFYAFNNEEYTRYGSLEIGEISSQSNRILGEMVIPVKLGSESLKILLKVDGNEEMNSEYVYPIKSEGEGSYIKRLNF